MARQVEGEPIMAEAYPDFKPETYGFERIDERDFYRVFPRYEEEVEERVVKEYARNIRTARWLLDIYNGIAAMGVNAPDRDEQKEISRAVWECATWQRVGSTWGAYPLTHCRRPLFCRRCSIAKNNLLAHQYQAQVQAFLRRKKNRELRFMHYTFNPCWSDWENGQVSVESGFDAIRRFRTDVRTRLKNQFNAGLKNSRYAVGPCMWGIHCKTPPWIAADMDVLPLPHLHMVFAVGVHHRTATLTKLLQQSAEAVMDDCDDKTIQFKEEQVRLDFSSADITDFDAPLINSGIHILSDYVGQHTKLNDSALHVAVNGGAIMAYAGGQQNGMFNRQFQSKRRFMPNGFRIETARFLCRATMKWRDIVWWAWPDEIDKYGFRRY